jgi:outer membrane receptor protein involved in Fe transport
VEGLSVGLNSNYMDRTGNMFLLWLDGDSGVWRANPTYQQSFHNTSFNIYPYITYFKNQFNRHSLKARFYSIANTNDTEQDNFDDTYYTEYQYQKIFPSKLTLITGSSFTYNESKSEIFGAEKHFGSNLSLYSQVDHKLFERLNFSLGARLEGYRIDEEELNFKPVLRTGLNYGINEITFLRGSFGMGYRYPTIAEKFTASGAGTIRIFPNHDLKEETGWSSELAIKRGIQVSGWNGYLDLALFWTEYHNMIEFMFGYHQPDSVELVAYPPDHPNFFQNWIGFKAQNVRNARIYGLDFTITGEGKFFGLPATLLAGYTYTNPTDLDVNKTGDAKTTRTNILKYRFYHNVKFDFEVTYKKLTFGLNGEYCSHIINIDKAFEDTVRYPNGEPIIIGEPVFLLPGLKDYREKNNNGFFVFDLRLGWNVSDKVRFTASAKNIFNKEYMIRPADVQPPRTYVVQLTIRI